MGKKYAVMLFETQIEHSGKGKPDEWVNYKNIYFDNGMKALNYYANTSCQYPQIIDAEDETELQSKMGQMILNYMDKEWVNKNIYSQQ
jgi:hypothetical protein